MARRFNSGSVNLKRSAQWVCDALQLNATLHLPDLKFLFAASHFWGEISCDARTCWNLQLTYNWPILAAALSLMMPCWHAERNGAGPPSTMELKWHPLKKTERWQISCKLYQKMESSLFKRIFSNAYSEFLESINIFRNSSVVKVLKFNFFCFQKGQILQLKWFIMEWTPTNLKFSVLAK